MNRVLSAAILVGMAMPASAQTPAGEITAGWSYLHSFDERSNFSNYPLGFHVGGARRITDSLGIAGDFGWNQKQQVLVGGFAAFFEGCVCKVSFTTFSGGPRFYFGRNGVAGFVHGLFGGIRRADFGIVGPSSETKFMIQPGGGLDIALLFGCRLTTSGSTPRTWTEILDLSPVASSI